MALKEWKEPKTGIDALEIFFDKNSDTKEEIRIIHKGRNTIVGLNRHSMLIQGRETLSRLNRNLKVKPNF